MIPYVNFSLSPEIHQKWGHNIHLHFSNGDIKTNFEFTQEAIQYINQMKQKYADILNLLKLNDDEQKYNDVLTHVNKQLKNYGFYKKMEIKLGIKILNI